jgi:hypothetical protein
LRIIDGGWPCERVSGAHPPDANVRRSRYAAGSAERGRDARA